MTGIEAALSALGIQPDADAANRRRSSSLPAPCTLPPPAPTPRAPVARMQRAILLSCTPGSGNRAQHALSCAAYPVGRASLRWDLTER